MALLVALGISALRCILEGKVPFLMMCANFVRLYRSFYGNCVVQKFIFSKLHQGTLFFFLTAILFVTYPLDIPFSFIDRNLVKFSFRENVLSLKSCFLMLG